MFYHDRNRPDGHTGQCKDCLRAYEDRPAVRERRRQRQHEYRQHPKEKARRREYGRRDYVKRAASDRALKRYYDPTAGPRIREYHHEYMKRPHSRHRNALRQQRREAGKRHLPHTLTAGQWEYILRVVFHNKCAYCGARFNGEIVPQQDHVIPLSGGGGYTKFNIVPACSRCNSSKSNSNVWHWLHRKGYAARPLSDRMLILAYRYRPTVGA